MKTLIILLLFTSIMSAQRYDQNQLIMFGFDTKLALNGAYEDEEHTLDVTFQWLTQTDRGLEAGIFIEYANLKQYYASFGVIANHSLIFTDRDGFETLLGLQAVVIQRGFNVEQKKAWVTAGANAIMRYNIGWFNIDLRLNEIWRRDIDKFVLSGYLELGFKFN